MNMVIREKLWTRFCEACCNCLLTNCLDSRIVSILYFLQIIIFSVNRS